MQRRLGPCGWRLQRPACTAWDACWSRQSRDRTKRCRRARTSSEQVLLLRNGEHRIFGVEAGHVLAPPVGMEVGQSGPGHHQGSRRGSPGQGDRPPTREAPKLISNSRSQGSCRRTLVISSMLAGSGPPRVPGSPASTAASIGEVATRPQTTRQRASAARNPRGCGERRGCPVLAAGSPPSTVPPLICSAEDEFASATGTCRAAPRRRHPARPVRSVCLGPW